MQAIERIITNNNWITLVIVFAVILLAIMKLLKPTKLFGYTVAFVTPSFFKKRVENNVSSRTPFQLLLSFFSVIIISLFVFLILYPINNNEFFDYLLLFCFVAIYFVGKIILDNILINVLGISILAKYFLTTKYGYLKNLALWLFPAIILYQYAFLNKLFLLVFFGILFIFRAFLIVKNNKKIVISKLFYFILYFCTLEIAPLLIVYKITTTT